jgi:hypothetical protein
MTTPFAEPGASTDRAVHAVTARRFTRYGRIACNAGNIGYPMPHEVCMAEIVEVARWLRLRLAA